MTIEHVSTPTMETSLGWKACSEKARAEIVQRYTDIFVVEDADFHGRVTLSLNTPLSAKHRGELLLNFENLLKEKVDPGITVWLSSLDDKNSLRNLRGQISESAIIRNEIY